jgi:lysophospholipase L1-like esterase
LRVASSCIVWLASSGAAFASRGPADEAADRPCARPRIGRRIIVAAREFGDDTRLMNRRFLLPLLGLLLFAPAPLARCAETNHNFAKWEKEIAAFEQSDRTNPPPKGAILFIGSSTIRLWTTLAADFPGPVLINRGFGGSEILDSTHFAERIVFPYAPRMIFFRAGGNDLANGKSPEQVFADFKEFVAAVHARLPETDIVFISWNPSPSRWKQADKEKALNNMVEAFVRQTPHVKYIETYDMVLGSDGTPRPELFVADQLHFSAEGYKLLAARVRPYLPK